MNCCSATSKKFFIGAVALLALAVAAFFVLRMRPICLPKPSGDFQIGMRKYHWIDTSRSEPHLDGDHKREIMAAIFYPAAPTAAQKQAAYGPTLTAKIISELSTQCGVPGFLAQDAGRLMTNTYVGSENDLVPVKVPTRKYPVILFSHGITSMPDLYTGLFEELVSHGYVVIAVSHPYACDHVTFPDGRVVRNVINWDGVRYPQKKAQRELESGLWVGDFSFALDQLQQGKAGAAQGMPDAQLFDAMDLRNIGVMGHSFGGGVAAQLCRVDDRVQAGINMDGGLNGPDFLEGFRTPFMIMSVPHEHDEPRFEDMRARGYATLEEFNDGKLHSYDGLRELFYNLEGDKYFLTLQGAGHGSFSDEVLLTALFWWARFSGRRANDAAVAAAVKHYSLAFFDTYLKRRPVRELIKLKGEEVKI